MWPFKDYSDLALNLRKWSYLSLINIINSISDAVLRKSVSKFKKAIKSGQVKIGKSIDTLIHRSWSSTSLYKDSAGCQVFANNGALNTMYGWAKTHISIYKKNDFVYTLLTKEQFLAANNLPQYVSSNVLF